MEQISSHPHDPPMM
jgi:hypothetical protein